jgi:outer membrane protein insertion porin family
MKMSKKISILAVCLLIFTAARAFPQEQSPGDAFAASDASSQSSAKTVSAIEIKGNKSISTNKIASMLKTRIGSPYQDNIISDDLKRLYLLGFFSDIKIDTEDYKDGLKVIINVVERPIIEKIVFSGTKRSVKYSKTGEKDAYYPFSEVGESWQSKEGQYLDYPKLADDVALLKKTYEKKGFGQVKIDYKVDVDPATNKAKVEFTIDEGRKQRIRIIYVEGNLNFSDRKILSLIKTKRAWLFNPGVLKEEVWKEDLERIKTFYHRAGFMDATVDYEDKTDPRGRFIYITLKITEGKKYLVGTMAIKGNSNVSETDILKKIEKCNPGDIFSQEALKDDILNVQGLYFDKGYISAYIQETTSLNSFTGRIDIVLNIVENQIAYVDKIKIRGNVKTKDVVIRREMRIKPGDKFDGDKLRRSKERLGNLGFFEEVSYDTEDTVEPNKKDLVVDVKEAKTGMFSFGGGYSTVDKFVGFGEIEQKNFDWKNFPYFTGDGQDLKLRVSAGSLTQGLDLSFTEPWIFDYPVSFGFDLYKRSRERESDVGYGYDEDVTGGDLRLGKEISEYLRGDLTYRYDQIKITNISEDATQDLMDEEGQNDISSIEFGLNYDTRDNVFNPTKGNVMGGSIQFAGGPFGGDKDFWKSNARVSHYFGLFNSSVLELRGRLGIADTYSDTNKIPIYERFFTGGAYSIRGYHERSIGPIDPVSKDPLGGQSMLIGNIEYTYPLINILKLAAFYDIGNVWAKASDLGSSGLKSGTGLGFRLKTPIGPVMLDYGIPLNKEPGEDKKGNGRFHFSMSHGF